ncbi:hypothetical protein E6B08_02400 [Pseudomonas putida]|uniref:Uncharacterized protein n=1 Tax=Pseudomonas putida TaxID=303 RepID=A0A4D6X6N8_PSEPU|nr:hypothetical protein [Pseudomonas putida]QCI10341.1 hypothetical protein E6B08_02400 [Pseudomonas putida]
MLKIVPDPPNNPIPLQASLVAASDYALCADAIAPQAVLLQSCSSVALLIMTSKHESDALCKPLDSVVAQNEIPTSPQTLH